MKKTAHPVPANTPAGVAKAGIINAYAAVQALMDFQPVDVDWSGTQTVANRHISGGEFVYKTYIFGAMVENKDYTIARNYLNSLATATEEQTDFVFTQNINLDRLEINNYQLAGEAQAQLYTIAKKPYPLSGYARSLYFVLTEELLDVDLPKDEDPVEERSNPTAETQGMKITSGPNPSGDTYEIRFDRPLETPYMVQVYGLDGRPVHLAKADKGDAQIEIKTGSWPTGVYFVKVSNTATGELLHSTKLVKH